MDPKLREKLDEKIPRDAVSSRDGGGGRSLDYLSNFYVIKRLNETLGQGNWSYRIQELTKVFEGTLKDRFDKPVNHVSYTAQVELFFRGLPTDGKYDGIYFVDVGYGDGTDKANPGKAHELAVKEAVTDGVKRCAKNLGMSLGLALYDKDQEFVAEQDETPSTEVKQEAKPQSSSYDTALPKSVVAAAQTVAKKLDRKITEQTIRSALSVLESKGKITKPDFKSKYLSNKQLADLNDLEVLNALTIVYTDYPELRPN